MIKQKVKAKTFCLITGCTTLLIGTVLSYFIVITINELMKKQSIEQNQNSAMSGVILIIGIFLMVNQIVEWSAHKVFEIDKDL